MAKRKLVIGGDIMYLIMLRTTKNTPKELKEKEIPIKAYQEYEKAKQCLLNIINESSQEFNYTGNHFWGSYINKKTNVKDNCKYTCNFKNGNQKEYYIKYLKLN